MIRRLTDAFIRYAVACGLAVLPLSLEAPRPAFATVNTQASSATVLGNGAQTAFAFNFIGVGTQYVQVLLTNSAGSQTQLTQGPASSQYQVSLNAAVAGATWGVGGTVTYNPGAPIPAGSSLTIYRSLPLLQAVSMANQGNIAQLGKSSEQASDLVDMQVQQVFNLIGRALVANAANSALPLPLPPAAQIANEGLCADSTGNNIVGCSALPAGLVSSAMQPVIIAATVAAGRTALGLGSLAVEGIGAALQDDGAGNARVNFATVPDASSQSVNAAFHLTQRAATGPITYTLPAANTLWNGFGFWVYAYSGAITFSPNASDNFIGQASGASLTILAGQTAFVSTNGLSPGAWYIDANSAQANKQVAPPEGRLTLVATSGGVNTPVMTSAQLATTSVCYTPYVGNQIPAWYGTAFVPTIFSEFCQLLSDTTLSPAAAASASVYDEFAWVDNGAVVVTRGPAWTNATTRGYTLTRVNGFLTNTSTITNGPQAGYGVFVGTIATDAAGATVTFNPTPAGASAGPTNGAWVGLWNQYNRVLVAAEIQDTKSSWTYATATWRAADASVNNRVTLVVGQAEDSVVSTYVCTGTVASNGVPTISIGLDSLITATGSVAVFNSTDATVGSITSQFVGAVPVGQHFLQAVEQSPLSGTATFNGQYVGQAMQLSTQSRY